MEKTVEGVEERWIATGNREKGMEESEKYTNRCKVIEKRRNGVK